MPVPHLTHSNSPSRPLFLSLLYLPLSPVLFHPSISRDPPGHLPDTASSSPSQHPRFVNLTSPHSSLISSNLSQLLRRQFQPGYSTSRFATFALRIFQPYTNAPSRSLPLPVRPLHLLVESRRTSALSKVLRLTFPRHHFHRLETPIMSSSDDDLPLASKPKMNGVNGGKLNV